VLALDEIASRSGYWEAGLIFAFSSGLQTPSRKRILPDADPSDGAQKLSYTLSLQACIGTELVTEVLDN
jgi:hypothetical protein